MSIEISKSLGISSKNIAAFNIEERDAGLISGQHPLRRRQNQAILWSERVMR
jgi:hypothetical protein